MLAWWEQQERGTLRASALTELQFNQNPQMDKNEKPFLYEKRPKRKQMGEKSDGYRTEIT